jgi:hypothetical protein
MDKKPSKLLSAKKGHPPFEPKWSNKKGVRVGFLAGRGHQSTDIATFLNDGTTPDTIRRVWNWAGLQDFGKHRNATYVPVRLSAYERRVLSQLAAKRGLSLEEWMRNVAINAGIPDDLYASIVEVAE